MPDRFIEFYEVQGIACLRHVRGSLTPLHAFIGPNDSGKSTLLRALRTALHLATRQFRRRPDSNIIEPFDPGPLVKGSTALFQLKGNLNYRFTVADGGTIQESGGPQGLGIRAARPWLVPNGHASTHVAWPEPVLSWLRSGSRFAHFIPAALREPSQLIPDGAPQTLADEYGRGLPGVYDVIFNRGDDSVLRIMTDVRRLFPTVKSLRLKNLSQTTKALEVELISGERVPAAFLSEGLLFYLAFAALQHLDPVALLLVEEPENGLHPSRIADVMRILREISKTTQVVLATHSPLVINEMQGDEVTLVTRHPEHGTQVKLLSQTPHFAERSKVYALGELWLSYANGVDEAPLLRGGEDVKP